jgi:hypothetical protein
MNDSVFRSRLAEGGGGKMWEMPAPSSLIDVAHFADASSFVVGLGQSS